MSLRDKRVGEEVRLGSSECYKDELGRWWVARMGLKIFGPYTEAQMAEHREDLLLEYEAINKAFFDGGK